MRAWALLLLLLLSLDSAWAGSVGPWIGVNTIHLNPQEPVNEQNRLIGAQYNRWFFAHFQNSFHEPSWALGYALWQRERPFLADHDAWRYTLRLSPGVAYGYGSRLSLSVGPFTPGLIPSAGVTWQFHEQWQLGSDLLYIWTDAGGVLLHGVRLSWQW